MEPTYEAVEPNVARITVNGAHVEVAWKCAATGREAGTSSATMTADRSVGHQLSAQAKRSFARELMYAVANVISRMLGGAAGRVARDVGWQATAEVGRRSSEPVYNEASRREAVLQAFRAVEAKFTWDETARRYVAR